MDKELCQAGKECSFRGRWTESCSETAVHFIFITSDPSQTPRITLCHRHFEEVYDAGLIAEPNPAYRR